MVLHLNKLESPSPKNALCQVWLKLANWFWRRSITLNEGQGPSLEQLESPAAKMLCAKFGWNLPNSGGEDSYGGEDENVNSLRQRQQ